MTDWHEMEASRDLDVLIAKRMGYEVEASQGLDEYDDSPVTFYDIVVGRDETGWKKRTLYYFSASVDDALRLVIDKAQAQLTLWQRRYIQNDHDTWSATFYPNTDPDDTDQSGIESAGTPALAICRAWFAWKDAAK